MKAVAILGSPRAKSNSSALARIILRKLEHRGAETREFILNKLNFSGCVACDTCKAKLDHCVLQDDLTEVLEAVGEADVLILASPVYFSEVSGQFKCFFDRTFSYLNPDFSGRLKPGKSSVFVLTQMQPDLNLYTDVYPRYETWLKIWGCVDNYLLRMNGPGTEDAVAQRPDIVSQAEEIADKLMSK